ncbi:hypothetical protein TIFTF001_016041 [Ficus carica]|uniref:Lycopene beta-cyclase n=1 Tax=Ficus carica TaxID=3494 RepID=A0AA88DIS0_FICCA|nr:hypothetical protein TIFTF001_016041 [Ficus carica]
MSSRPTLGRIKSSNSCNFHELKPDSKLEILDFDLPQFNPCGESRLDVIIIGTGPAGLCLAEQVDEFESLKLENCLERTWPIASLYIDEKKTKYLKRHYGQVSTKKLKSELMQRCLSNGVLFHKAKVWKIEHQMLESSILCDDGKELKSSLVVDASRFRSTFLENDKPRNHGYQIGYEILAEVNGHPFDINEMVLMDLRDSHLENEPYLRASNSIIPTFLYAMPFDSNLIFLEETTLVSRPALSYAEVKRRLDLRLCHLGIRAKKIIQEEKSLIPMGGPLPRIPQNVMAISGSSGLVHPSTGYMLARTMGLSTELADTIAKGLGSTKTVSGKTLRHKVWNSLWPIERRCAREYYCYGMETMLKLDLSEIRRFFDAFFDTSPYYWEGFLSSRLNLGDLALFSLSIFGRGSRKMSK